MKKYIPYLLGISIGLGIVFVLTRKRGLTIQGDYNAVVKFFTKKGLTLNQAIGIAGNLRVESDYKADAVGDNGTSFGIAQWHNERWDALKRYAIEKNEDYRDFYTQLDFIWYELNSSESNALTKLREAKTVEQASLNFAKYYERPQASTYAIRETYSKQIENILT